MKKTTAAKPSLSRIRSRLMERIRDADLPKDAANFNWHDLEAAGLYREFKRPQGWDDKTFRLFVLLAEQAKLLRAKCSALERRIGVLEDYHSPLWEKVAAEPCPIKQQELRRAAMAEDARINDERFKQRDPFTSMMAIFGNAKLRPWKYRDRRRKFFPFRETLWHEPMTVMDFHEATGLSRRTLHNLLKRLGARPVTERERRNEPARYGPATNGGVLCEWLKRYVKDLHTRRAFFARTLVYCDHKSPQHYAELVNFMAPAILSLGFKTKAEIDEFKRYVTACKQVLYPPLPSSHLLGNLASLSAILAPAEVPKNG